MARLDTIHEPERGILTMSVNFVAEIGMNHEGSLKKAKELVDAFDFVDVIKIQTMTPKAFLSPEKYNGPHPDPARSFGETYGEHKEAVELAHEEYRELAAYIKSKGLRFALSVFDIPAARRALALDPEYVKIPSCLANNWPLIDFCLQEFRLVHVSTGMTTAQERNDLVQRSNNIIPYSCTSNYADEGPVYFTKGRGFSCHSPHILFGQMAAMMRYTWVEYHVTMDRDGKHTDHRVSLLPGEYRDLVEWYNENRQLIDRIQMSRPRELPEHEKAIRQKLWSKADTSRAHVENDKDIERAKKASSKKKSKKAPSMDDLDALHMDFENDGEGTE